MLESKPSPFSKPRPNSKSLANFPKLKPLFQPYNVYNDDPLDYGELSDSKNKRYDNSTRNKNELSENQNKLVEQSTMSPSTTILPEIVEYSKPFQLPPYESDNLNKYISKQIDLIQKDQVPAANR